MASPPPQPPPQPVRVTGPTRTHDDAHGGRRWEPVRALRPVGLPLVPSPGAAGALLARYSLAAGVPVVHPSAVPAFAPTDVTAALALVPSPVLPRRCGSAGEFGPWGL